MRKPNARPVPSDNPCYRCVETKPLAACAFRYTRTHKRVRGTLCKECINESVKLYQRRRHWPRWLATLPGRTYRCMLRPGKPYRRVMKSLCKIFGLLRHSLVRGHMPLGLLQSLRLSGHLERKEQNLMCRSRLPEPARCWTAPSRIFLLVLALSAGLSAQTFRQFSYSLSMPIIPNATSDSTIATNSFGQSLGSYSLSDGSVHYIQISGTVVREQMLVTESVSDIRAKLPFAVLGLDVDNDSAFINDTLVSYCRDNKIELTRCRAYKKNDQA